MTRWPEDGIFPQDNDGKDLRSILTSRQEGKKQKENEMLTLPDSVCYKENPNPTAKKTRTNYSSCFAGWPWQQLQNVQKKMVVTRIPGVEPGAVERAVTPKK